MTRTEFNPKAYKLGCVKHARAHLHFFAGGTVSYHAPYHALGEFSEARSFNGSCGIVLGFISIFEYRVEKEAHPDSLITTALAFGYPVRESTAEADVHAISLPNGETMYLRFKEPAPPAPPAPRAPDDLFQWEHLNYHAGGDIQFGFASSVSRETVNKTNSRLGFNLGSEFSYTVVSQADTKSLVETARSMRYRIKCISNIVGHSWESVSGYEPTASYEIRLPNGTSVRLPPTVPAESYPEYGAECTDLKNKLSVLETETALLRNRLDRLAKIARDY